MIRIATRASALAQAQSAQVGRALFELTGCPFQLVLITTKGDVDPSPLSTFGGGVFISALRRELEAGHCDIAVHSMKDLPTTPLPGICLGAVPPREDPLDALVTAGATLDDLPTGARIGTGSPRRAAQLLAARPDLTVVDIRGNVPTRIRKLDRGEVDGVILAKAGLVRLGLGDRIVQVLDGANMLPAPAQGALAVEYREGNYVENYLAQLDHLPSRLEVTAERQVLATLEAGCAAPVGARAVVTGGTLTLSAVAFAGSRAVRRVRASKLRTSRKAALGQAVRLGEKVGLELAERMQ